MRILLDNVAGPLGRAVRALIVAGFLPACSSKASAPDVLDGPTADSSAPAERRAAAEGKVKSIAFSKEKTFTIASTTTGHLAFPSVTALADKRILLVYREGATHADSTGRIVKQVGSSDASIWSSAEVLYDEDGIDDRDPSVRTLANGDVVLSYFRYNPTTVSGNTLTLHHIFFGRSKDGGKTFSTFVQVDPGAMSMTASEASLDSDGQWVDSAGEPIEVRACSSPVVELGGKLLIPAYGGQTLDLKNLAGATRSRISFFVSADQGKSWTEEVVNEQSETDVWLQEPSALVLDGSRILVHLRTASGTSPSSAGYLSSTSSSDGGKSWSAYSDFDFIGHAPDLYRLENGVLLSAYRGLDSTYSEASVAFVHSLDGGATWSAPLVVEDCGAVECGYPSLLELDGDKLLIVYYASGGLEIKGAIYKAAAKF
jgi:hypothetical protein